MAFTEAQLLTELQASGANLNAKIIAFIPVSTTHTDVLIQNNFPTKEKTGPMVQVAQTNTAAQALVLINAQMN